MGTFLGREPVAIAAFLAIAINLGISFGLNLSAEQVALINALIVGALALLVRSSVTAPANLPGTTVTTSADGESSVSNDLD